MNNDNIKGYHDQEVLIGAIARHVSTYLNISEGIVRGKVRMALEECSNKHNTTFKEIKFKSEKERDAFVADLAIIFFDKMKLDIKKRRTLKFDSLQIYERWKSLKRDESIVPESNSEIDIENTTDESSTPNENQSIEEESLLDEFNSLDLDGLL